MLPVSVSRTTSRCTSAVLSRRRCQRGAIPVAHAVLCRHVSSVSASVYATCGGRRHRLAIGELARMADGSAIVEDGATAVMATVVSPGSRGKYSGAHAPFVPLTVDYRQRAAAAGRIPTNHLRREMGASTSEVLTGRVIDRSLRSQFPRGFAADTQITCAVLSADGEHLADVLAVNAASTALACSTVPWHGPVAAVRVGWLENQPVINPTRHQLRRSTLDMLMTVAPGRTIAMLEVAADNILHNEFTQSLKAGLKEAQAIIKAIEKLQKDAGIEKQAYEELQIPDDIADSVHVLADTRLRDILTSGKHDKISRDNAIHALRQLVHEVLCKSLPADQLPLVAEAYNRLVRQQLRHLVSSEHVRCDGRRLNELRPLSCRAGLYPPLHGSALFQRGQTQVLATVAFDSPESALKTDLVSSLIYGKELRKNFMLHYEFPSFATAELAGRQGRAGAPGRREIGHGALAERALRPVLPADQGLTVRLTAEVLESNGSSSMAAVCAGSVALLDAGVALKAPVAGVAVGLVTSPVDAPSPATKKSTMSFVSSSPPGSASQQSRYTLLTDLLGIEDYCGDMDFKLACTAQGITALQADFKLTGVPMLVVTNAIKAAVGGIDQLLALIKLTTPDPRAHSDTWPVTRQMTVPAHQRMRFLGAGGTNLRRIAADTGVQVTSVDETTFSVFAPSQEAMVEAEQMMDELLAGADQAAAEAQLEFGAVYDATVVEVLDRGVMVRLHPSLAPALVRTAQLDQRLVQHPQALGIKAGDKIAVKYFGRDPVTGHMRLSRKAVTGVASDAVKSLGSKSVTPVSSASST